MANTNDPQAYAKAILAEVKRQKTKGDDKQLQALKRENDKLLGEVTKLKEQTKVLQGESKKVGKLETKVASLTSDKNDQQRKIANLSRAVQGIKREYGKKLKEAKSSGAGSSKAKSWIRSKGDIAGFNKASAGGEGITESGFGNALGVKSLLNRESFDKRIENKKEKDEKKKEKTTEKINKSGEKLDKNFVGMDKTITAINRKLTLFGIALSAVKVGEWGVAKHEETKGNIHSAYSAGLNLQQGKEWIRLAQTMGNDPQAIFGEMAQLKHQKDLTMRGATNVWTEQQQKFLFSNLPNSLNLNPNDWMRLSPQQLYKHIMQQAQGKIKEKPNEAGAILAGLKESGFSNLATMLEKAGIAGVELDKFQESLNRAVDVPRGMENATFEFSRGYQEAMARIDNATDRFVMALMKLSKPLVDTINNSAYFKTSQEGMASGNKITAEMATSKKSIVDLDTDEIRNVSRSDVTYDIAHWVTSLGDKGVKNAKHIGTGMFKSIYENDDKDKIADVEQYSQMIYFALKNDDENAQQIGKTLKAYSSNKIRNKKAKSDPKRRTENDVSTFLTDAIEKGDYEAVGAFYETIPMILGDDKTKSLLKYNEPTSKVEKTYTLDELNKMSASNSAITQSVNNEKIGVGQNGIEFKGANSKIEVYVKSDDGLTTDVSTMGSTNNMVEVYNQ